MNEIRGLKLSKDLSGEDKWHVYYKTLYPDGSSKKEVNCCEYPQLLIEHSLI
jgi:hypothetical protein